MNQLLTLLFICASISAFGQSGSIKIGPSVSYESVSFDFKTDKFNQNSEMSNQNRLSFGLLAQYGLSQRLNITLGALYSTQEFSKEYNWIFLDSGDPLIPRTTAVQLEYLRVPLMLGWKLGTDKVNLIPSAGLNFDFLINSEETSVFEDDSERDSELLKTDLASPHTFISLDLFLNYNVSDKLSIGVAPYLNQALDTLDNEFIEKTETNIGGRIAVLYSVN